jgi:4-hydroxy-tetrahydrodipicolinate synthase
MSDASQQGRDQAEFPRFHGIYASTILPMFADGTIDEAAAAKHMASVASTAGMRGLLVNGHAGENAYLSREESRRVVEIARAAIGSRLIVAGINAEDSRHAALLAQDAAAAGADAIMVFAPFSWALGADPKAIFRHHRIVHEATGLPMFLFQGSVNAGRTAYTPDVLAHLLSLDRVVGIKEGSWETSAYESTRRLVQNVRPDVAVMASGDEHLLACFVLGSEGSLVSLAAIVPKLVVALDAAVRKDSLPKARRFHAQIYPLAKAIYGRPPGGLATARLKACLKIMGKLESAACRAPVLQLSAGEFNDLKRAVMEAGVGPR